ADRRPPTKRGRRGRSADGSRLTASPADAFGAQRFPSAVRIDRTRLGLVAVTTEVKSRANARKSAIFLSRRWDSNPRPCGYETAAQLKCSLHSSHRPLSCRPCPWGPDLCPAHSERQSKRPGATSSRDAGLMDLRPCV